MATAPLIDLEWEARILYHECAAERGPRWDQLGETTKSVWRERVLTGQRARLW